MIRLQRFQEILRYLIVGALGVGAYCLVFFPLTLRAGWGNSAAAVPAFIANTLVAFLFQRRWTFKNKAHNDISKQVRRYFGLNVGLLFLNMAVLYYLADRMHWAIVVAQICSIVIGTSIGFMVSRLIFRVTK